METLASKYPPWLDLRDELTEVILEHLPLSDYVRFPAVCRRWRSVQSAHRRHHSPPPPPMARLPWIISNNNSWCSPFEDRTFTLLNPISGSTIQLPSFIPASRADEDEVPSDWLQVTFSPPHSYMFSIYDDYNIFLFRWFDCSWIEQNVPLEVMPAVEIISCGGKHYFILEGTGLVVVDPLASPATFQHFKMMGLTEMGAETGGMHSNIYFVDFGEKPLLVMEVVGLDGVRNIVGFEVFRADLSRKMWVKVESIGCDRVLMLRWSCSVLLLAADIGARGNCIHFCTE